MKTKQKIEQIESVMNLCDGEKEAMAAIYVTPSATDFFEIGDPQLITDAVRRLLLEAADSDDERDWRLAHAIMRGVYEAIDGGLDPDFAVYDDDEDDCFECVDCDLLDECQNENAVKWRKILGMPKPKNKKRRGKK